MKKVIFFVALCAFFASCEKTEVCPTFSDASMNSNPAFTIRATTIEEQQMLGIPIDMTNPSARVGQPGQVAVTTYPDSLFGRVNEDLIVGGNIQNAEVGGFAGFKIRVKPRSNGNNGWSQYVFAYTYQFTGANGDTNSFSPSAYIDLQTTGMDISVTCIYKTPGGKIIEGQTVIVHT